jgi:hypothetical protein
MNAPLVGHTTPGYSAVMSDAGLAWQTLPEAGSLALVDAASRRAVAVTQPCTHDLSMDDVVEIEHLVTTWTEGPYQTDAEQALLERLSTSPERLLRALTWLLAMWAVAVHVRTGQPPTAIVRALSYRGVWRSEQTPYTEQVWEALTERVRLGALAALTGDPATDAAFDDAIRHPPGIAEALMRHSLDLMRAVNDDMRLHNLDPAGLARALSIYTAAPALPVTQSFRPLR